jgi:hypothetical protein
MSAALPLALLLLMACGPAPKMGPLAPTSSADPPPRSFGTGTLDTASAYRTAIADYINAMRQRDGSFPGTVYIGRHDQFPHIDLPAIIEHTSVRIVAPSDAESLKNSEHFAYLNIFGWFGGEKVEFFVVSFTQGMRHRPDGADDRHLFYSIAPGQKEFALDSLRF